MKLLVANRGEIAIRIIRAAAELNIPTVAIYPEDDAGSLHTGKANQAILLEGLGTAAYLDIDQIVDVAVKAGCDAVHPGYGFLAENGDFARRCGESGLTFIGPPVAMLELFGDKARARAAASAAGVPIMRGLDHSVTVEEATAFFEALGDGRAMMIKAVGGGGGRGSRMVETADAVASTYQRCRSEAQAAFGNGELYVEEFIQRARHVEVQILGDAHGDIAHLGERECSVQRHFQKIIEVAPAPDLDADLRDQIIEAAVRLAGSVGYSNAGTFEFLVDISGQEGAQPFAFIEANARLQVEHTVTEEVTGVDIVKTQLRIAQGASIAELGLDRPHVAVPRGYAIQARVCMETVREDGSIRPTSGTLSAYEAPSGPGVRTDGFGYGGYQTSLLYDSLLAKVIGHSPSANFDDAIARTARALSEFRVEGVETNIPFLLRILSHADFATGAIHTRFVDEEMESLAKGAPQRLFVAPVGGAADGGFAGAQVEDAADPLALFTHDTRVKSADVETEGAPVADGPVTLTAPVQGTLISVAVISGDEVHAGQPVATIESLELHYVVRAARGGTVHAVPVASGESIRIGDPIAVIQGSDAAEVTAPTGEVIGPELIRTDLAELHQRRSYLDDDYRAEKIARRHAKAQRSPRENLQHLLDGTFREYGPLVTAASWQKKQWLRETTQADGLLMGIGHVNSHLFPEDRSRVIAVHYDYMVVAGTQGGRGHYKQDRMYVLAKRFKLPLILFSEGGGGRPGISGGEPEDNLDLATASGLREASAGTGARASVDIAGSGGGGVPIDSYTFTMLPELSGLVPLVGINSGRCFAGNTVLLACCDVIIAAENSTIGLGGPAMIEGGGLGIYTPEEVGPMSFQVPNGVVDILVKDDEEAVEVARQYISYFQGAIDHWTAPDQQQLRHIVPEDRALMYDMRAVIETIADEGSVLEIRQAFGIGIITAFIRVEGMPMGLIANNPEHLSGAIDSDASDKAARFLQLCDTFDIPVLSLMDCPGIMVGPEHERQALLRKCGRLFVTGANMTSPIFGVVVRKAYGLGVQAMCGGSSMTPFFTVAWPTAEFAPMTIDGSVRLAFGAELDAIEDPAQRQRVYNNLVGTLVDQARAVNSGGTSYGIDDVIDPLETRDWIAQGLRSVPKVKDRDEKKRPNVDTW